jgi:hypothetical protein
VNHSPNDRQVTVGGVSVTIPVTVPIDLPGGLSWSKVFDRTLGEKMDEQRASAKTGQHALSEPAQSGPADEPANNALEPTAHEGHERHG